jgi:hypothetical protein
MQYRVILPWLILMVANAVSFSPKKENHQDFFYFTLTMPEVADFVSLCYRRQNHEVFPQNTRYLLYGLKSKNYAQAPVFRHTTS